MFGKIGHFFSSAAHVAGRELGHAVHPLQGIGGALNKAVGKIPIVGAPVHTILGAAYHTAMMPAESIAAVARGQNLSKVTLNALKSEVRDVKSVAPYAQMVMKFVPGWWAACPGGRPPPG